MWLFFYRNSSESEIDIHRISLRFSGCDDLCIASIANPAEERLRLKLLGSQKLHNLQSIPASDAGQTVFVKLGLGVYKIIQVVRSQFQCVWLFLGRTFYLGVARIFAGVQSIVRAQPISR